MIVSPLFAALPAGDIAELVIGIIVFVVVILSKLVGMVNQQKPPVGAGQPKPPPKPAPRDALSNEIDDFLRRAAQRRQQNQSAGPPRRPPAAERAKPIQRPAEQPASAEVVARPMGDEVERSLKKFTEEKKQFEQRAARLGGEVAQADDKIEAHLKEKFSHRLGTLERQPGVTAAPLAPQPTTDAGAPTVTVSATAAAGFAALLTTADNIRQAVVLTEILNRPTDRWE
jgi:hypothetical protein